MNKTKIDYDLGRISTPIDGGDPEFSFCCPFDPLQPPFISESAPVLKEEWQKLGKKRQKGGG